MHIVELQGRGEASFGEGWRNWTPTGFSLSFWLRAYNPHHLQGSIIQFHRDDEGEPLDERGGGGGGGGGAIAK